MEWQIFELPAKQISVCPGERGKRRLSVKGIHPAAFVDCADIDFLDLIVCHMGRDRVESAFNLHGDLSPQDN